MLFRSRGISTYTKIGLTEFFKYPLQEFSITINEQTYTLKKHMLVIANASQFGNSAIIAPTANITDGKLELVAVQLPNLLRIPGTLYRLFKGQLKDNRFIQTFHCDSFIATSKNPVHLHIDGESLELTNKIEVKVIPHSLNLFVPNHVR